MFAHTIVIIVELGNKDYPIISEQDFTQNNPLPIHIVVGQHLMFITFLGVTQLSANSIQ